jgi:hypothetical protein
MLSPSLSQTLTLEDFLGQYRNNPRYELAEGEIIDLEPTGPRKPLAANSPAKSVSPLITDNCPGLYPALV